MNQNELRLTPDEICKATGCVVPIEKSLKCPWTDKHTCPLFQPASLALAAQLDKLQNISLEEVKDALSQMRDSECRECAKDWVHCTFMAIDSDIILCERTVDRILFLISPIVAAKIEAVKAEARQDAIEDTEAKFNFNIRPKLEEEARAGYVQLDSDHTLPLEVWIK